MELKMYRYILVNPNWSWTKGIGVVGMNEDTSINRLKLLAQLNLRLKMYPKYRMIEKREMV